MDIRVSESPLLTSRSHSDEAIRSVSPGAERASIVVLTEPKGGHLSLAEDASLRFVGKVKVP